MKQGIYRVGLALLAAASLTAGAARGSDDGWFEVTVTNLTRGEIFTPVLVASHGRGMRLFKLGTPAGEGLEQLAEGGDTGPLAAELLASGALDVVTAGGVLPPGQSVTLKVRRDRRHDRLSVASMLVPSNDAFFAVNGLRGPRHHSRTVLSPAYDAGTEDNDELCVSIPGPPFICAGEGFSAGGGEGYVYIHPGIQGVGDLVAARHDWRNPVAQIVIRARDD